jgi:uncharacterized protein with HEPN domain
MSRSYRLYLQDIVTAIDHIDQAVVGLDENTFTQDQTRFDSVLFNFITIGEAVKHVPDAIQARFPDLSWREMARFRDVLVHHYFLIERAIVWEIVMHDLPPLRAEIVELLQSLPDED